MLAHHQQRLRCDRRSASWPTSRYERPGCLARRCCCRVGFLLRSSSAAAESVACPCMALRSSHGLSSRISSRACCCICSADMPIPCAMASMRSASAGCAAATAAVDAYRHLWRPGHAPAPVGEVAAAFLLSTDVDDRWTRHVADTGVSAPLAIAHHHDIDKLHPSYCCPPSGRVAAVAEGRPRAGALGATEKCRCLLAHRSLDVAVARLAQLHRGQ